MLFSPNFSQYLIQSHFSVRVMTDSSESSSSELFFLTIVIAQREKKQFASAGKCKYVCCLFPPSSILRALTLLVEEYKVF